MEKQTENFDDSISVNQLLDFVKKYWLKTMIRGGVSLFLTLAVFALVYAFLPMNKTFTRNIGLRLKSDVSASTFNYPNGKAFVDADLISQAVLRKVYEMNHLEDRIAFPDFVGSFYISSYDIERTRLDAAYRANLSQKGIKIAEIQSLELRYKEELAKLPNNWRSISMKKLFPLKESEQIKIVNDIPAVWFDLYSQLEMTPAPQIPSVALIADLEKHHEGYLSALEMSRLYLRNFSLVAEHLNQLADTREIKLKTGESLGDIQNQLAALKGHQFPMLYQYFLATPALRSRFDVFFVQGQLDAIERQLTKCTVRHQAAEKALEIILPRETVAGRTPAQSGKMDGAENLTMDNSFLPYFAQMVRNEYNNSIRKQVAGDLIKDKETVAELEAEKQYYLRLVKGYSAAKNASAAVTSAEFDSMFRRFQKSMAGISIKLTQLKELLIQNYSAKRNFYIPEGNVRVQKSALVSPVKLLLGLAALFALYNAVMVLLDFNKFLNVKQD